MRDGWRHARLGEVAALDIEAVRVEPGHRYAIAGVLSAGQGLFKRQTIEGFQTNYPTLHRLRAGQLVMRKLTAWEGPISCVPAEYEGFFVSAEFPTFTLGPDLLPAYMSLVCQRPEFWELMKDRSTGSVQRRKRVSPAQLLAIEVDVPPLAEQRRIVDLIGAVDDLLKAASALASSLRKSHRAIREEWLSKADDVVRLGHVIVRIDAGRSPDAEDRQPAKGETTVLKVSAVRPGWFDRTQVKVVKDAGVFPTHALVRDGDLLMIRANGNADLLGVVCITEDSPERCFLSDKTLRVVPDETAVHPVFLMEALMSADSRRQIALCGTGTASMKNISQASIENLMVPLLPPAPQAVFVALTTALRVARRNADREAATLSGLRAALLTSLMSGDRRMSRSYDRFLDGAA
jgi:type I restriction enzyme S subunit